MDLYIFVLFVGPVNRKLSGQTDANVYVAARIVLIVPVIFIVHTPIRRTETGESNENLQVDICDYKIFSFK